MSVKLESNQKENEKKVRNINITSLSNRAKQELLELRKKNNGYLSPKVVVNFARNIETAMHSCFEWDDSIAGEMYRLHQARMYINYRIEMINLPHPIKPGVMIPVPSMMSPREFRGTEKAYVNTIIVMNDPDLRESMLKQARGEFMAMKKRYQHLVELADIWPLVDSIFK